MSGQTAIVSSESIHMHATGCDSATWSTPPPVLPMPHSGNWAGTASDTSTSTGTETGQKGASNRPNRHPTQDTEDRPVRFATTPYQRF